MSAFDQTLATLRANPLRLLSERSPLSLGAFMFGYSSADASITGPLLGARGAFGGPSDASLFTGAYLSIRDDAVGLEKVLDVLERTLSPDLEPLRAGCAGVFLEEVFAALRAGRPGIIVSEPLIVRVADCFSGYFEGLCVVDPTLVREKAQLDGFAAWIQRRYLTGGPWFKTASVFLGAGPDGLARLVEHWDEYLNTT